MGNFTSGYTGAKIDQSLDYFHLTENGVGLTPGTIDAYDAGDHSGGAMVVDANRDIATLHDVTLDGDLIVTALGKVYLDADGGHSYLAETAADVVTLQVGGVNMLVLTEAATDVIGTAATQFSFDTAAQIDTSGNAILTVTGGTAGVRANDILAIGMDPVAGETIGMATGAVVSFNSADKLTHSANTMRASGFTTWDMGAVAILDFDGATTVSTGAGALILAPTTDVDVTGASISVDATEKVLLDGIAGHTYIAETAADTFGLVVGATTMLQVEVGKVGIENTSLETWDATTTVFQIGGNGAFNVKTAVGAGGDLYLSHNAYQAASTNFQRMDVDEVSQMFLRNGTVGFRVADAASEAPDVDIVWTTALTIDNTGYLRYLTTAGITADVGSAQGNGALTSVINQISICVNAGDAVTLPAAATGLIIFVMNDGAQSADVFPAAGDDINEAGANVAYALAADKNAMFIAHDATHWSVILTA